MYTSIYVRCPKRRDLVPEISRCCWRKSRCKTTDSHHSHRVNQISSQYATRGWWPRWCRHHALQKNSSSNRKEIWRYRLAREAALCGLSGPWDIRKKLFISQAPQGRYHPDLAVISNEDGFFDNVPMLTTAEQARTRQLRLTKEQRNSL